MNTASDNSPEVETNNSDNQEVKPNSATSTRTEQIDEPKAQVELVAEQVAPVQNRMPEKKTPLFRQPALIVSIAALLISTGFSGYTAYQRLITRRNEEKEKKEEEIKKKLETLRQTIIQLTDMRLEFARASLSGDKNWQASGPLSSIVNTKRQTLIETANALIQDLGDRVSASIFCTLAAEVLQDSRFDEAESFFLMSLRKGNDPIVKSAGVRGLAVLYMTPGTPLHNIENGRARWQEAIQLLKDRSDDYSCWLRGDATSLWAFAESSNGNRPEATSLFEMASQEYSRINEKNPLRRQMLDQVKSFSDAINTSNSTGPSIDSTMSSVEGNWDIQYKEEPARTGKAVFILNQQTKSLAMTEDVFENGKLVQKALGNAIILSPNNIRIDWTGSKYLTFNAPWSYVTGTTTLKLSSPHRCSGIEYILGDKTYTLSLKK